MKCLKDLKQNKKCCQKKDCRQWIDFEDDLNCTLEAIAKNEHASMTLREVGNRLGVSFVRIKQIEDAALKKLLASDPQLVEYLIKDDF
jgi:DNA-directed RNA polymerase sigma subunit (sigma70/sigma32)